MPIIRVSSGEKPPGMNQPMFVFRRFIASKVAPLINACLKVTYLSGVNTKLGVWGLQTDLLKHSCV